MTRFYERAPERLDIVVAMDWLAHASISLDTTRRAPAERLSPGIGVVADRQIARLTLLDPPAAPATAKLFRELARIGLSVQLLQRASDRPRQSLVAIVGLDRVRDAVRALSAWIDAHPASDFAIDRDVARIAVTGGPPAGRAALAPRLFAALAQAGVVVECVATTDLGATCIIAAADFDRALRAAQREFL